MISFSLKDEETFDSILTSNLPNEGKIPKGLKIIFYFYLAASSMVSGNGSPRVSGNSKAISPAIVAKHLIVNFWAVLFEL